MDEEKSFDLKKQLQVASRRKWWVILPTVAGVLISIGVYWVLPKVYRATTLILVQPQRVPETYVHPTITESITERLHTMSQEILSRTRLEKVIQEFNLYPELRKAAPMEEVVETMRQAIEVNVQQPKSPSGRKEAGNTFTISYEGNDPRSVMMVTNRLASLFIEENLKNREVRAEGTSEFLNKEVKEMAAALEKKEEAIRRFREKNLGALPQQLDANLKTLERLQQQLKTTAENIKIGEDRIWAYEREIERLETRKLLEAQPPAVKVDEATGETVVESEPATQIRVPPDPLVVQLENLKRELETARSRYTENHPDVVMLKRKIADLEPKAEEAKAKQAAFVESLTQEMKERKAAAKKTPAVAAIVPPPAPKADPVIERLIQQYRERINENRLEVKKMRSEENSLKEQIQLYQRRVEDTPKREQELSQLTRDYELMKKNYESLLDKRIQAQLAENLERKQQGEQFRILDPARVPEKPIRPDLNKTLLIGVLLGLATGVGLAWMKENMDQSFHSETDVQTVLGLPLIAVLPNLRENEIALKK